MKPVAIVTGASSGIGRMTAIALVAKGYTVYDFSRRNVPNEGILHVTADVTDSDSINRAVQVVLQAEGHIDLLVNNAGFGISGAVEFTNTEEVTRLFDVNFFGTVRVVRAVLSQMRQQGSGRIVNISSVAAICPIPFQTFYSASKSAIMTYSMALANEVRDFGITVCAVLPGDIKTGFTNARAKSEHGDDVYNGRIARSVSRMEHDEENGMSAVVAGRVIAAIASGKSKKPLHTLGFGYRFIAVLVKLLPAALVNRLIKILYAK